MVPYAGYDPSDRPFGRGRRYPESYPSKRVRSSELFKAGKDTLAIARLLGVQEKTVLRWISEDRSARLGRPNPYGAKS